MVKKALTGGEDCRKCEEASDYLKARGLWERVDEIVWAIEDDPDSPRNTNAMLKIQTVVVSGQSPGAGCVMPIRRFIGRLNTDSAYA